MAALVGSEEVKEPIRPGSVPEDVFSAFIEQTPDFAIVALDKTGLLSSWNPGAERMNGYAAEEVVGKHMGLLYTAQDVANRRPQYTLQRALQEGRFEDEGWRVRKDGTMFWANVVVTPIRARDGTPRGFVKVTRDLTARKHAEEALRENEERYRLLVESVKDYAIFLLDPAGHVMSWNAGAERLKGYQADEIVGRHFRVFYTPQDQERGHPEEVLQRALAQGRYEEEGWRVRKDGTKFWASVTLTPLHHEGREHVGFAKITRDLTEKKRAEDEIRARATSYEELNRELDAFSHTVAHDLRSPLRAIEHLSSVLLEEEAARVTKEGKLTLEALHTSALQMARLVQDLLDLSTAAGREPNRADVDVTALAKEVARDVRGLDPARDVALRVQDGLKASADAHLLRVLLTNLLSNALKFTKRVPHAVIEVGAAETPHGRAFFVRDNGVGFEQAKANRLFQPFIRLHPANEYDGTGIGLATVWRIVKRHGGTTWAEAKPNEGATFYFTLPDP